MNEIKKLLSHLSKEQNIQLGIYCIDRTIELLDYSICDSLYEFMYISFFIRNELNKLNDKDRSNISRVEITIWKCEDMIDFFEDGSGYDLDEIEIREDNFAKFIIKSMKSILEYFLENNYEIIYRCIENNYEILKQLESEECPGYMNKETNHSESIKNLERIFSNEYEINKKIISMIINNDMNIAKYIEENKINEQCVKRLDCT
jgi:hypothetical protein